MSLQTVVRPEGFTANLRAVRRTRIVRSAIVSQRAAQTEFVRHDFVDILNIEAVEKITRAIGNPGSREYAEAGAGGERISGRFHLLVIEIHSQQDRIAT